MGRVMAHDCNEAKEFRKYPLFGGGLAHLLSQSKVVADAFGKTLGFIVIILSIIAFVSPVILGGVLSFLNK